MPEKFDPYRVWLGIPAEEQPPSHYRLLGIPLFEDNPDAIDHAADQRMAHLRTLQTGKHAAHAQKLLNEIARARVCLLNPDKKAKYDRQLQKTLTPAAVAGHSRVAPTETLASPGELGEYRLLEKLGEGGMGAVYKAMHTRLGRVVAVKLLRKDHVWDERSVARFDREMKAAGAVDHPNVVRAMDAREVDGTRLLAMEFIEGLDLGGLVRRAHPIAVADACELARQAAVALQAVHEHGLVHRDVKPSNLMLGRQGQVKLLDLGLARFQVEKSGDEEVTGTAQALGTVDYMAPEQLAEARSVDIRADIYSLGCTLYKLLAGRPPFGGPERKGTVERAVAHAQEAVPPIRKLRPDVPAELARVLADMLAKSPDKRPSTPGQVAEALAPLALGSDLPGLLTRVELGTAAKAPAEQAALPTREVRSSSGLTKFFQKVKQEPAHPGAVGIDKVHRRKKPNMLLVYGGVAAGLMLAIVLVAFLASRGKAKPTGLLIDWPEGDRVSAVLMIDEKEVPLPAEGSVTFRAEPGQVHVHAWRAGFKAYDEIVTIKPGGPTRISPAWKPETFVVLDWPPDERLGAKLTLDGNTVTASTLLKSDKPEEMRLPVEPGPHKLWLGRRGFVPFERDVTVREGESFVVRPQWREVGEEVASTGPIEPVMPVEPSPGPKEPTPPGPSPQPPKETPTEPTPPKPPEPVVDPALVRQRELEARFAEGMKPVEEKVAAWDFAGALEAAEQVKFDEEELTARLAQRREEIGRMAGLKERMIAKIEAARPPLKKSDLMLKGFSGEVTGADDSGITAKLSTGKTETHAWNDLGEKAPAKLLELVVNQKDPDDWLAAGLLAFAAGDTPLAERLLAQAQKTGADIAPYLSSLAAATFAEATALLDAKKFKEADAALTALETKYATTPWFAANQTPITAAREAAKSGIYETEAEKLYTEAAKLFAEKELFDVRDLTEKLKADYPKSAAVTDASRKPPFSEMADAVANLGQKITVRLDGKGDFTSIGEAINAAQPNSLIEIQDNGPYSEPVGIPATKSGLTIQGARGIWPVVTSSGADSRPTVLCSVSGESTALRRLLLLHTVLAGEKPYCLVVGALKFRAEHVVLYIGDGWSCLGTPEEVESDFGNCLVLDSSYRGVSPFAFSRFRNCLILSTAFSPKARSEVHSCTINKITLSADMKLVDSLIGTIEDPKDHRNLDMSFSASWVGIPRGIMRKETSFVADPQFLDPKNLDYRLADTSPCKGKASDGGDLGCRYTPEMIEMCKIALQLRARGIIKF